MATGSKPLDLNREKFSLQDPLPPWRTRNVTAIGGRGGIELTKIGKLKCCGYRTSTPRREESFHRREGGQRSAPDLEKFSASDSHHHHRSAQFK
jgi:hypothetical protein